MPDVNVLISCVVLAAGKGTRLGLPDPKPLTPIGNDQTILGAQVSRLEEAFGASLELTVVTGHMSDNFDFLRPQARLVTNPRFAETNTAKSLLVAMESLSTGPVLWLNGDVVFKPNVLAVCKETMRAGRSFMVVNQADTGEEEVKYSLSESGEINAVGKKLNVSSGEAVGINFVSATDFPQFVESLRAVADDDYFEAAIQLLLSNGQATFFPVTVGTHDAMEIDTPADLATAIELFGLTDPVD